MLYHQAMPLPTITGVTRCAITGVTAHGTPWANILHVKNTGAIPTLAQYTLLAAQIDKLYGAGAPYSSGVGLINSAKTLCTANLVTFTPLDGSSASSKVSLTAAGAGTSNSMPAEVAEVVTFYSTLRGRSNRGRIYLPAYTVSNINADGTLAGALATSIPAQFVGWASAIAGLTPSFTHVIASYLHATSVAVASYVMNLDADVQRRRKS